MLMLYRGERVSDVARTLCCARLSVGHWFTLSGVEVFGEGEWKVKKHIREKRNICQKRQPHS